MGGRGYWWGCGWHLRECHPLRGWKRRGWVLRPSRVAVFIIKQGYEQAIFEALRMDQGYVADTHFSTEGFGRGAG